MRRRSELKYTRISINKGRAKGKSERGFRVKSVPHDRRQKINVTYAKFVTLGPSYG